MRLVATKHLPRLQQSLQSHPECERRLSTPLSDQAKLALDAGWYVGADLYSSGYRVIFVDAGVEKSASGCVPIGASALVFTAEGLVAIAYDRNGRQSSRLSGLTQTAEGIIRFSGNNGLLADLALTEKRIGLQSAAAGIGP